MTATLTCPAGSETAEEARQVLSRAKAAYPWPDGDREAIVSAVRDLSRALKRWYDLRNGIVSALFPGMRPGGRDDALRLAADDAWTASEEVRELTGENIVAAAAAGTGGES